MTRQRRYFTTPLGSGRSERLGRADPRARRDAVARASSVQDPLALGFLTEEAAQALIDTSIDAIPEAEEVTFEQVELEVGVGYPDVENDYRFTTFGVDGAWETLRHRNGSTLQTTGGGQTGTVPTTLTVLRALDYTDIPPVPVP